MGVCVATPPADGDSCDAGSGTIVSGTREARSGACDISGGTNNGMYDGSGACMINTGTCTIGGDAGTYDGSGICVANPIILSCEDDTSHADRRMVFMRGEGGVISTTSSSPSNADVTALPLVHGDGFVFYEAFDGDIHFIRDGNMVHVQGGSSGSVVTQNGVTFRGRLFEGASSTQQRFSQHGDRVAFVASGVLPTDADFIYRTYLVRNDPDNGGQNIVYIAQVGGTTTDGGYSSTTLASGEFYLDDDYALTGDHGEIFTVIYTCLPKLDPVLVVAGSNSPKSRFRT